MDTGNTPQTNVVEKTSSTIDKSPRMQIFPKSTQSPDVANIQKRRVLPKPSPRKSDSNIEEQASSEEGFEGESYPKQTKGKGGS